MGSASPPVVSLTLRTWTTTCTGVDAGPTRSYAIGRLAAAAGSARHHHRAAGARVAGRARAAPEPLRRAPQPGRGARGAAAYAGAVGVGPAVQERAVAPGRPHGGGRPGPPRALRG